MRRKADASTTRPRAAPAETAGEALLPSPRFGHPDRALALAFAIGAAQGLSILIGRHWPLAHPGTIVALSIAALIAAPVIWGLSGRIGTTQRNLLVLLGTVMTSTGVTACGPTPSSMSIAYIYAVVILYAGAFFPARVAAGHLAFVGAAYGTALALHPMPAMLVQWVQEMGALAVIWVIVAGFAEELRRAGAARAHALLHDPLTGLGNRGLFLDRLDRALAGENTSVALLSLNIDDFRTVNASVGKEAGDQLLIAIARRLVGATRAEDVVARLGGDDFAVLVESGPMPQTALAMASRISASLSQPFTVGGVSVKLEACVGISLADRPGLPAADLLRDADVALYMAKKAGKGRVELVQPGMRDDAMEQLALLADLRQAIENQQFEVYYQPVVSAADARPVGAEALLRWPHPSRGMVGPNQFIPLAEAEGLIVPLGRWVLEQACVQARQWIDAAVVAPTFRVSVNVSPAQLARDGLVTDVAAVLAATGIEPDRLVLEITESALVLDVEVGRARLRALADLGLHIALDDFGTGYSSLNRLRHLPVDVLKVDKSFVDNITCDPGDVVLLQTVITAGHGLGAIVVAEGVETTAQYELLRGLGCDAVQGFLFARPEPAHRALERIGELADATRRARDYSSSG